MTDKTSPGPKKLVLSKETVLNLDPIHDDDLEFAAGGAQTNDGICANISLSCRTIC